MTRETLKVGDPVTVTTIESRAWPAKISLVGVVILWCVPWEAPSRDSPKIRLNYMIDDEGVTWIRGHHSADSTDVLALESARGLLNR